MKVLRREREVLPTIEVKTSLRAMQSITDSLKREEEEQQRKKKEEEEQKEKEQAIRDSINREIMRTAAEDILGTTWNSKSIFNRML